MPATIQISEYQKKKLSAKRLIFIVGAGRDGSAYLANLLSVVPSIASFHEPYPFFKDLLPFPQPKNNVKDFLIHRKLPLIVECANKIYVETAHTACKTGSLECLIELDVKFDLIYLKRDARKVALSYLRLGVIPGRSLLGLEYLWAPKDINVFKKLPWENWSDYQLCYWYALSIDLLADSWRQYAAKIGFVFAETSIEECSRYSGFFNLLAKLRLPRWSYSQWFRYSRLKSHVVNKKSFARPIEIDAMVMKEQEAVVNSEMSKFKFRTGDFSPLEFPQEL